MYRFHRLFQHSTQPQLEKLKSLITKFNELEKVVKSTLASLGLVVVYLTGMAYVVFLHLVYLLTSIYNFNVLETHYVLLVITSLVALMARIKAMLLSSSSYLHRLMNNLIKLFCRLINDILALIKAKLLYFLNRLELQIYLDMFELYLDLESMKLLLLKLQSEVLKYIQILKNVNDLLTTIITLTEHNKKFKEHVQKLIANNNSILKVHHIFSYKNDKISEILKDLKSIKLIKSIELTPGKQELVMNLKINLGNIQKHLSSIVNLNSDKPLIVKVHDKTQGKMSASITNINDSQTNGIQKFEKAINKLLEKIDVADRVVSKKIMSIIGRLLILETINLGKLYILINRIQLTYEIVLIRIQLLSSTIKFHKEITDEISTLIGLMDFDCSKVSEFLGKCSSLEKKSNHICDKIHECIIKLAKLSNQYKSLGLAKEVLQLYVKLITRIFQLKFYVDLLMREILIFKSIIHTLIVMASSSAMLDELIKLISGITKVEDAIAKLMAVDVYLKAFYLIQLHNAMTIFGLSSRLLFSESIHEHYHVLLYNLQLINELIWVLECFIIPIIIYNSKCANVNIRLLGIPDQIPRNYLNCTFHTSYIRL